ncbi:hypothetical protein FOL47_001398 [Perkinsus chesapeaki]|uniref:Uncharacterized protein n=1 Tax=Perkinsus chesapeaki TaxID=330153 RepID=A0A7J6KTI1_PERCH|nr:hypothetical protein FOL47_001398 [Perkinsus chesapeaki]
MPKGPKSDAVWQKDMIAFAASKAKAMPRGCAPSKGSKWYVVMQNIIKCPYGTRHILNPLEVRGCECGYHSLSQPKQANGASPGDPEANTNKKLLENDGGEPRPTTLKTTFPTKPLPLTVGDIRGQAGFTKSVKGILDLFLYGPTGGECPTCGQKSLRVNAVSKLKMVYTMNWPYFGQGLDLKCTQCNAHCTTFDRKYTKSLPHHLQQKLPFISSGASVGVCKSLITPLRMGMAAKALEDTIRANLSRLYGLQRSEYQNEVHNKLQLKLISASEPFGDFPEEFVAKAPALLQAFLVDYHEHRVDLRREQAALRSTYALSLDHQAKVVRRTKQDPSKSDVGTQSFSVIGDFGLVLGYFVVPDTSGRWIEQAMKEIMSRHGEARPPVVYLDCGCCSGKLQPHGTAKACPPSDSWDSGVTKKLDTMHLLMRISREVNGEHVRRQRFLRQLSQALFRDSEEDLSRLKEIRDRAGLSLTSEQLRSDRYRFVRRVVGDPQTVCAKILLVMKANIALDAEAREQCIKAGMPVDDITPASPAYPLVTRKVKKAIINQCIHILNGCVSDQGIAYVRSLRGTSKVEAVHSCLSRSFTSFRNFRTEVFDARASWFVANYNRRRLKDIGRKAIPCGVAPVELPGEVGLAPEEASANLLLGFEYARAVTKVPYASEELDGEPDQDDDVIPTEETDMDNENDEEETTQAPSSDTVPLDIPDCIDAECLLTLDHEFDKLLDVGTHHEVGRNVASSSTGSPADSASEPSKAAQRLCQDYITSAGVEGKWIDKSDDFAALKTPSKRNVSRRRSLGGSLIEVPPDFNPQMKEIWIDIWSRLTCSTGGKSMASIVWEALAEYNRRVALRLENSDDNPPALLPVSYGHALKWMKQQRQLQQSPAKAGVFTVESQKINYELDKTMAITTPVHNVLPTQSSDLPEALIPDLLETTVADAKPEEVVQVVYEEPQARAMKRPRCRTCGSLFGKDGHPRGKCPEKAQEIHNGEAKAENEERKAIDGERAKRALATIAELGLTVPSAMAKGQKRCPLCRLPRDSGHLIKNNRVIYCQYADPIDVKEEFEQSMEATKKARYTRYNTTRPSRCNK